MLGIASTSTDVSDVRPLSRGAEWRDAVGANLVLAVTPGSGVGESLAAACRPADLSAIAIDDEAPLGPVLRLLGLVAGLITSACVVLPRGDEAQHEPAPGRDGVLASTISLSTPGGDAHTTGGAAAGRRTLGMVPLTTGEHCRGTVGLPSPPLLVPLLLLLLHLDPAPMPLMLPTTRADSPAVAVTPAGARLPPYLEVGGPTAALAVPNASSSDRSVSSAVRLLLSWPLRSSALNLMSARDTMARTL